mgnify:FL=1
MNIKTKKYLVIPVILLCLSGIVDARWHFHGGSVKDIPNRIKQAVETAKQNEVLLHIRQLSSDYKDIVAVWEPFKESVTSLYSLVFGSSHENPVSELLRTGKEIEEIKEKINERTQSDLTYKNAGQINVKETRDKNWDNWLKKHEDEFLMTLSVSDRTEKTSEALNDHVETFLNDNSGNAYAFAQKRALLKLAAEQAKSNNTQLKAQSIINTIDGDFMEENYQNNAAMASAEQDLRTPLSNDELHLINSKKYRIRELPR